MGLTAAPTAMDPGSPSWTRRDGSRHGSCGGAAQLDQNGAARAVGAERLVVEHEGDLGRSRSRGRQQEGTEGGTARRIHPLGLDGTALRGARRSGTGRDGVAATLLQLAAAPDVGEARANH